MYIPSLLSFPLLPHPTPLVITLGQTGLPVMFSHFPLTICFTPNSVYMSMLLSQFVPPSPSPTVTASPFSTRLISTIFLDSMYVCVCVNI